MKAYRTESFINLKRLLVKLSSKRQANFIHKEVIKRYKKQEEYMGNIMKIMKKALLKKI